MVSDAARTINLPIPMNTFSSEDSAVSKLRATQSMPTLMRSSRTSSKSSPIGDPVEHDLSFKSSPIVDTGEHDLSLSAVLPGKLSPDCNTKASASSNVDPTELETAQSNCKCDSDGKSSRMRSIGGSKCLLAMWKLFCSCIATLATCCGVVNEAFRDWWSLTGSSDYLIGTGGRRQHWKYTVLPVLIGSGIFNQVSFSDWSRGNTDFAAEVIAHSVLLVFSYLLALTLPRRNLWPDFMLISALLMSTFLPILFSKGDDLVATSDCQSPVLPVIFLAPLFCSIGVHAIVVSLGSLIAMVTYSFMVPASSRLLFLALSFASLSMLILVVGLLEHYAANVFCLQLANRQIVENCADGHLKVSLHSGIVTEACPGTTHHFGQLEDSIFSQVLPRLTDKKMLDDFLVAVAGGDMRSIVVTGRSKVLDFQTLSWPNCNPDFEAKLVPVICVRGEVLLCFQVRGRPGSHERDYHSEGSIASDALSFANSHGHGLSDRLGWDFSARLCRRRSSEQMSTLSELSISEAEAEESPSRSPSFMSNFLKPSSRRSSHSMISMWTSSRRTSISGDFMLKPTSRRSSRSDSENINRGSLPHSFGANILSPSVCSRRSHRTSSKKDAIGFRVPFRGSISTLHSSRDSQGSHSPLSFSESESESIFPASPHKSFVPAISVQSAPVNSFASAEQTSSSILAETEASVDVALSSMSNSPPSTHASASPDGKPSLLTQSLSKIENEESLADAVMPFASDIIINASSPSASSPSASSDSKGSKLFVSARALPKIDTTQSRADTTMTEGSSSLVDRYSQTEGHLMQCEKCARPPLPPSSVHDPASPGRKRQNSTKASSLRCLLKRSRSLSATSMDAPLQLPAFLATPVKSKHFSIELVLSCWNNVRRESICCSWHAAIDALRIVAGEMGEGCRKEWQPFHGIQCPECQCLVEEDEPACLMCSAPVVMEYVESRRTSLLSGSSRQTMSPMPRYPLSPLYHPHTGSDSSSSRRTSSDEIPSANSDNCAGAE